jgi:ParB family chromosome partitioning protein
MSKHSVLGKGLSALIPGADLKADTSATAAADVSRIALEAIGFNPEQPRKTFDDNALDELSRSIKEVGILQPVLVRRLSAQEQAKPHPESATAPGTLQYCVVAGERRVRAARLAGLSEVPALVCTYAETEALKVALLENIQREDLDPVEEARAYHQLMENYGATQEELSSMLGKRRSTVANMLRLLSLEDSILDLLQKGDLTRGHAKALLAMEAGPARQQLAKLCASRGLSVREVEQRVAAGGARPRRKRRRAAAAPVDPTVRALQQRTERVYGSPVAIDRDANSGKGTISLRFYGDDDLVRLLKIMGVDTDL